MGYNYGLGIRRPRGRLRKRNTIRGFRKYYNFSTENNGAIYDRDRIRGCLDKAWVGFRKAKRVENYADMKLYASVIQRVEKELKI